MANTAQTNQPCSIIAGSSKRKLTRAQQRKYWVQCQAAHRLRLKDAGLCLLQLKVPAESSRALRAFAFKLLEQHKRTKHQQQYAQTELLFADATTISGSSNPEN